MSLNSLESRLSKLEEKAGAKQRWRRVVRVVSHEHYPPEKLNAFLRENGVDPEDPEIFIIHLTTVEPDRGCKGMLEPYFAKSGETRAR